LQYPNRHKELCVCYGGGQVTRWKKHNGEGFFGPCSRWYLSCF
jgi:hypothetical protein